MKNEKTYIYAVLAIAGTVLPLSEFIPWVLKNGPDVELFFSDLFSNHIGGFFGWDVIVSSGVLLVFILSEGRRLGIRKLWFPILGALTVGVSLGLPLFLLIRERHLSHAAR